MTISLIINIIYLIIVSLILVWLLFYNKSDYEQLKLDISNLTKRIKSDEIEILNISNNIKNIKNIPFEKDDEIDKLIAEKNNLEDIKKVTVEHGWKYEQANDSYNRIQKVYNSIKSNDKNLETYRTLYNDKNETKKLINMINESSTKLSKIVEEI